MDDKIYDIFNKIDDMDKCVDAINSIHVTYGNTCGWGNNITEVSLDAHGNITGRTADKFKDGLRALLDECKKEQIGRLMNDDFPETTGSSKYSDMLKSFKKVVNEMIPDSEA